MAQTRRYGVVDYDGEVFTWTPPTDHVRIPTPLLRELYLDAHGAMTLTNFASYTERARETLSREPLPETFGLNLYPYQREGAYRLVSGFPYLADEPGLGKTRQLLAAAALVAPARLLIICPSIVVSSWAKEAREAGFTDIETWTAKNDANLERARVIIVPDSLLVARPHVLATLGEWTPRCLLVDEAHRYKNGKAKRTQALMRLSRKVTGPVLAASGTPIISTPLDLLSCLTMTRSMEKTFGTTPAFLKEYFSVMPWGEHRIRQGKLGQMMNVLENCAWTRRLKADVLSELPDKIRQVLPVEVDLRAYEQSHADVIEKIDEFFDENESAFAQMSVREKKKAITGYARASFTILSALRHAAGMAKIPPAASYIRDFLADHPRNNGVADSPLIVWCHHKDVIAQLAEHMPKKTVCEVIDGSTSIPDRARIVEDFQAGNIDVLLASISAAGVGMTLTRSSQALFVETDWTPALMVQAEDRIHRIGQKNAPQYTTLLATGTLDEAVNNVLWRKEVILSRSVGGDNPLTEDHTSTPAALILESMTLTRAYERGILTPLVAAA